MQDQQAPIEFCSLHNLPDPHGASHGVVPPEIKDPQDMPRSPDLSTNQDHYHRFSTVGDNDSFPTTAKADTTDPNEYTEQAENLVRTFTHLSSDYPNSTKPQEPTIHTSQQSSHNSKKDARDHEGMPPDVEYVPAPQEYKPSVLGAYVKSRMTASQAEQDVRKTTKTIDDSPRGGTSHPVTSGEEIQRREQHQQGIENVHASSSSRSLSTIDQFPTNGSSFEAQNDPEKGSNCRRNAGRNIRNEDQDQVVGEIADIIASRCLLVQLCESFMRYGAPTHRLEDYLKSAARALGIDAVFVYIPGTMTCTFRDDTLQSNTIELIRGREALDFARLQDAFDVYKRIIHEPSDPSERKAELDSIESRPDEYTVWFRIFMFGLSSVLVGPFSFQARPIDFVPVFFLSCAIGFMQLKVVPRSDHFSNVFEVAAAVVVAFAARGLGSIKVDGSHLFCFSAMAQSGIALILPGFMILNAALELQGQSLVAGSVRMVYAIIYVLFLGFGLLIGMTLYGLMDRSAVTETTCRLPDYFEQEGVKLLYTNFLWVPLFACSLAVVYRARWTQLPVMALISVCGYQAYYWMSTVVTSGPQISNAIGALVIGFTANIYSRIFQGPAATNMLPAIYCLVPGGLATSGSLVAGVQSSEDIVNSSGDANSSYTNTVFSVGSSAIQICIGTSVGLYLSALVVYPYGKKRSGLFSFS